jgi:undecaprenyl-diphosphatase
MQPPQHADRRYPRLRAFLAARFSRTEYLGLHLTVGLALSVAALWILAAIAEDVVTHDPLTNLDLRLAATLHQHSTATGISVARGLTLLGSPIWLGILGAAVAVVLLRRQQRILLLGWVSALVGGSVLDFALKHIFRRPRPFFADPVASARGWSFPSGHAMGSLVVYGMLAYVIIKIWPGRRTRLVAPLVTAFVVLIIGVTRLYLGVHYLSDVLAGYAAGFMWLAACISGVELVARRGGKE